MSYIWQIGVVVKDVKATTAKFMELMNISERPPINEVGNEFEGKDLWTIYKGDTASKASCLTCCFQFENVELEFIQPWGQSPSEWQRFLDEKGEGIHHLAWKIDDVPGTQKQFKDHGYEELQSGSWGEGEYHYFDTAKALGFVIENLKIY